jgi:hypothetical protein
MAFCTTGTRRLHGNLSCFCFGLLFNLDRDLNLGLFLSRNTPVWFL